MVLCLHTAPSVSFMRAEEGMGPPEEKEEFAEEDERERLFQEFAEFYDLSEYEREICMNCPELPRCLSNFQFGRVTDACYPCRKLCLLLCPRAPDCTKIPEE